MKKQKYSVCEDTLNFHTQNGDKLLSDKNGVAIFLIDTQEPFLKVYVDGRSRLKWAAGDEVGAYNMARQLQFEDVEADAALALGQEV